MVRLLLERQRKVLSSRQRQRELSASLVAEGGKINLNPIIPPMWENYPAATALF